MKKIMCLVLLLVLIPAVVSAQGLEVGEKAPGFKLENLAGEEVNMSDFTGKVVILHFWKAN